MSKVNRRHYTEADKAAAVALYQDRAERRLSIAEVIEASKATVADVIADELGVSGYARATLASKTATLDAGNNRVSLDAADVTFSALGVGATIGGAVVFRRAGGADDNTDPLLAFVDLNDLVTNGGDVVIAWDAGGILRFAVA